MKQQHETGEALRRLTNERDYWRRRCEAVERKYAPLAGASAIALVLRDMRGGRRGPEYWTVDTVFIDDPGESVARQRALRAISLDLEAAFSARAKEVIVP